MWCTIKQRYYGTGNLEKGHWNEKVVTTSFQETIQLRSGKQELCPVKIVRLIVAFSKTFFKTSLFLWLGLAKRTNLSFGI